MNKTKVEIMKLNSLDDLDRLVPESSVIIIERVGRALYRRPLEPWNHQKITLSHYLDDLDRVIITLTLSRSDLSVKDGYLVIPSSAQCSGYFSYPHETSYQLIDERIWDGK